MRWNVKEKRQMRKLLRKEEAAARARRRAKDRRAWFEMERMKMSDTDTTFKVICNECGAWFDLMDSKTVNVGNGATCPNCSE